MPARTTTSEKPKASKDPFNLHHRLEQVFDWLLSDWEDHPEMKNRTDALKVLQYGGMYLSRNAKLQESEDVSNAGSAVKRYSGAFRVKAADAASSGARGTGRSVPALIHSVSTDNDDEPDDAA